MKPLTAEDLVVGGKYVPHSKSVGNNSLEDMKARMKNEYLYYNGMVDKEHCFGLEPLPANDFWNYRLLPSDVTPYHEPNQTTMNTDYTEQPFNLETALKHPEWVRTRDGREIDFIKEYPERTPCTLAVVLKDGDALSYFNNGSFYLLPQSPNDLILRVPYREVWVNI